MAACVQALGLIGRPAEARRMAEDAVPVATEVGDVGVVIDLCLHVATEAVDRGDTQEADEWHARALAAAESSGDVVRTAHVLMGRGLQRMLAGQREDARADYERAFACASEAGEPALAAAALGQLATISGHSGDQEKTHEMLLRAQRMAASAEPALHPGTFLVVLVHTHWRRGDFDEARRAGQEALSLAREFGRRPLEAETLTALCDLEMAAGNLEEARALATRSVALRRAMGGRRHDATASWWLAAISRTEGDLDGAEALILPVLEQARATPTPLHVGPALKDLGEIARARGDVEAARERFTEAAESHAASGTSWAVVDCLVRRARVEIEGGLLETARLTLDEAVRLEAEYLDAGEPSAFLVWRVIAGQCAHDLEGIPEPLQVQEAADMHLALHVAGRPGDHLAQALRKLEHLSRHLAGEALERFWRWNVTARRARERAG
jgi:tetratricopeptide (TPR) repeat protein